MLSSFISPSFCSSFQNPIVNTRAALGLTPPIPPTENHGEMSSLSESCAAKLAHTCPEELVNHNKNFLTRVYPNSSRVDSSNYNPQDFWNSGCQLGEWRLLDPSFWSAVLSPFYCLSLQTFGVV